MSDKTPNTKEKHIQKKYDTLIVLANSLREVGACNTDTYRNLLQKISDLIPEMAKLGITNE